MPLTISPFLRTTLLTDAAVSGAAALLLLLGAPVLQPLLGLPQPLMLWSGAILVPFVVLLLMVARRETVPRLLLVDIVLANVAWVIASFAVLAFDGITPSLLGVAFVVVQALAVAGFALLQAVGLRSAPQSRPA